MTDVYEVCRYVKRYHEKNGYAPTRDMLGVPSEFVDLMTQNGVIDLRPLHESGPALRVFLTDKGYRMATQPRRRR